MIKLISGPLCKVHLSGANLIMLCEFVVYWNNLKWNYSRIYVKNDVMCACKTQEMYGLSKMGRIHRILK